MRRGWMPLLVILVIGAGGVAIAVQAQFTGILDRRVGTMESVLITYLGGGILIGVIAAVFGDIHLDAWGRVPTYAFLSGALGLLIIGSIAFTVNRAGLLETLVIMTLIQFVAGALIAHFGWFGADVRPLEWDRALGVALMVAGTYLVVR
jgi:transporter family-2 protein